MVWIPDRRHRRTLPLSPTDGGEKHSKEPQSLSSHERMRGGGGLGAGPSSRGPDPFEKEGRKEERERERERGREYTVA